jgi:hypothetical protein
MSASEVEPWYLAEIRDAFARIKHPLPSIPSRRFYDPLYKKEQTKELFGEVTDYPVSVNGWLESVHLYVGVHMAHKSKVRIYGGGLVVVIDHVACLEGSVRGSADSIDHWQIAWTSMALGQLWRSLRSHGVRDPRTREVKLVVDKRAMHWLSPGQRVVRAKMSQTARNDWQRSILEADKWTGMQWIENKDVDPVERRANKLAVRATEDR